jgi:hypothetical protein
MSCLTFLVFYIMFLIHLCKSCITGCETICTFFVIVFLNGFVAVFCFLLLLTV